MVLTDSFSSLIVTISVWAGTGNNLQSVLPDSLGGLLTVIQSSKSAPSVVTMTETDRAVQSAKS